MTFSLALRRDGVNPPDFQIVGGRLVVSTGADTVRDRLFTALSTQQTEWFLDDEDGVPYYGGILGGKMTQAEVGSLLRRRILLDPEVDRIDSMDVTADASRHVSVAATVRLALSDGTSETITVET